MTNTNVLEEKIRKTPTVFFSHFSVKLFIYGSAAVFVLLANLQIYFFKIDVVNSKLFD